MPRWEGRNEMVSFELCEGNPGALTFMMEAYMKNDPFRAERAFSRMEMAGIRGAELFMLWNDCCDRITERALNVMERWDIDRIKERINAERGRGIPIADGEISSGIISAT